MFVPPNPDCNLCPRLADFRSCNRVRYPTYHNAPVPSFGSLDATHLIVGLAPGLHGANQTGRPFTADYAGDVLYDALLQHGFATDDYKCHAEDGLALNNVRITNSVRCVPPQNKPETFEIVQCNGFLTQEIASMPHLRAILVLGNVAHGAVLKSYGLKLKPSAFRHGATYTLKNGITLLCSYHCSRYNINTRRLTVTMFDEIMNTFSSM